MTLELNFNGHIYRNGGHEGGCNNILTIGEMLKTRLLHEHYFFLFPRA